MTDYGKYLRRDPLWRSGRVISGTDEREAEIERLRVRVAELKEALDAIIHLNSPEAGWNAVQAKAIARAALIDKEEKHHDRRD